MAEEEESIVEDTYKAYTELPFWQQLIASVAPVSGEAISAYETPMYAEETKKEFEEGDVLGTAGSAAMTGLSALGTIPGLGMMARGVKGAGKVARSIAFPKVEEGTDLKNIFKKTDKDIKQWQKENRHPEAGTRRYRDRELEQTARDLDEGNITVGEFKEIRDFKKPLRTYGTVPELKSEFEIFASSPSRVEAGGMLGINKNIEQGTRATTRFDIDAYNKYDKYLVRVGDSSNKTLGYGQTAVMKDVNFNYKPHTSFRIAKGETKSPFATMEGSWQDINPEAAKDYADKAIKSEEWVEVSFDPAARLSFYNRATGEPVFNADEAIQIGPMILARGIKKPTAEQLEKLVVTTKAGKDITYVKGGVIRNPYSYAPRDI